MGATRRCSPCCSPSGHHRRDLGNDEMALGAIAALKEAGKLNQVKVGGFDGSPDAVAAIKARELQYTVLQPVAVFSAEAVKQADTSSKRARPALPREAAVRLPADHAGQRLQVYGGPSPSRSEVRTARHPSPPAAAPTTGREPARRIRKGLRRAFFCPSPHFVVWDSAERERMRDDVEVSIEETVERLVGSQIASDSRHARQLARRQMIAEAVMAEGTMRIEDLTERFGISLMTVHRDIDELVARAACCARPAASSPPPRQPDRIERRLSRHPAGGREEGDRARRHAVRRAGPGDLHGRQHDGAADGGHLRPGCRSTIITNSLALMNELKAVRDVSLLGSAASSTIGATPSSAA